MSVYLRPLAEEDIPLILEWMKDKEIVKFFREDFLNYTCQSVAEFIRRARKENKSLHFAVADENNEYLGTISLKNIDYINKNAEYAVALRAKAMGTGAAANATRQVLEKAFNEYGLNKVYLNVVDKNIRAISFYKKMGFELEGIFKKHIIFEGILHDLHWYAIYKPSAFV